MSARSCIAVLVALASAQGGHAATIYTGTNFNIQANYLEAFGANGRGFTLTAVGKNGAHPNAFDSTKSGQGGTGITTTGNLLQQVWQGVGGSVPTPTSNLITPGSIPQTLDTHFLVDTSSSSLLIAQPPTENRPLLAPTLHPFAGFGSYLTGVFALLGTTNSSWNFAYIVVPAGTTVNFNFEVGAPGYVSEQVMASLTMNFTPGDVNMDGPVDIFDINLISSNWGSTGPAGDANGDGIVDIFDINLVSSNWTSAVLPIPEPSTLVLAVLGTLAILAQAVVCRRPRRPTA